MGKLLPFVLAMAIYLVAGKAVIENDDWWENGHFYQIYPRSYKDSDGDGVGDLKGIIEELSHLKSIGVSGVWLSPIFKSPMKDFGYDISDFRAIDPIFGTMEDFDRLAAKCKELGIKLILDFVPNHSSDEHVWFKASADPKHPEHEKYKDFYIWNKGKLLENGKRAPPSNWLSMFRGSAWEWVEARQEYYLHQYLAEQPDLNYRHADVMHEMNEVLRFWLRKGVSGFRIDTVMTLVEADKNAEGLYDDEPLSGQCSDDPLSSCYLKHTLTQDQDETYDLIYEWRKVVDEDEFKDHSRILMTEAYASILNIQRYYGRIENGKIKEYGSHVPFNFDLILHTKIWNPTIANDFKSHIDAWLKTMPKGKGIHSNWVLGNHDQRRIASRYGPTRVDIMNMLLKTLPGITVTYCGEEIGMTDVWISWEDTVDPQACRTDKNRYDGASRDPARTPMQWNSKKNAGFTTGEKTWLPVATNYTECNVELQEKLDKSHLKIFRELIALRSKPSFNHGTMEMNAVDGVLVYKRAMEGNTNAEMYVVVLNLAGSDKTVNLSASLNGLPQEMEVVVASLHSTSVKTGDVIKTNGVSVPTDVGLVLVGKK